MKLFLEISRILTLFFKSKYSHKNVPTMNSTILPPPPPPPPPSRCLEGTNLCTARSKYNLFTVAQREQPDEMWQNNFFAYRTLNLSWTIRRRKLLPIYSRVWVYMYIHIIRDVRNVCRHTGVESIRLVTWDIQPNKVTNIFFVYTRVVNLHCDN